MIAQLSMVPCTENFQSDFFCDICSLLPPLAELDDDAYNEAPVFYGREREHGSGPWRWGEEETNGAKEMTEILTEVCVPNFDHCARSMRE